MISVVLLGGGNVASHLYKAFLNSEFVTLNQWYNRSLDAIKPYKDTVAITTDINTLKAADVYVIAVRDDAIVDVSKKIPVRNAFVVHTSGSVGLHAMEKRNTRGVFYPLQTFSKERSIDFINVPICIESEDKVKLQVLKTLAEAIGSTAYKINTEQRQTIHLSAVFVNNFTNHLYRIAHEISDAKNINFEIFKPLIQETANKLLDMSPYMSQTGPAIRGDSKTIKRHSKSLENEMYLQIYKLLTASIQKTHRINPTKIQPKPVLKL